jgi:hypothetical protein
MSGKIMSCILPSLSSILHFTVPNEVASEFPFIPFICVLDGVGGVKQSLILFVIDLLAQLSTISSKDPSSKWRVWALSLNLVAFCAVMQTVGHAIISLLEYLFLDMFPLRCTGVLGSVAIAALIIVACKRVWIHLMRQWFHVRPSWCPFLIFASIFLCTFSK